MDPCPLAEVPLGKYKGTIDGKYALYQTLGKGQFAK